MRLVSTTFGQILYQVPMDEIKPPSGLDYLSAIQAVGDRYRFMHRPTDVKEVFEKGIIFGHGAIKLTDGPIEITAFGIYNDGLLITTSGSTDDAEVVTNEFVQWATTTFGLRQPTTPPRRHFGSQVVVDFEHSIDGIVKGLSELTELLNAGIRQSSGGGFDLHVMRLTIGGDPHVVRFPAQSTFYIEPRSGRAVGQHRYFSGAPLTTALHLEFLAKLEAISA